MTVKEFKSRFSKFSEDSSDFKFEERKEQMEFLKAWSKTLDKNDVLLINAPTGIGKTFAYLYPAIERVIEAKSFDDPTPFKVMVATSTINLQEQIYFKDIPVLKELFEDDFSAVILKGRNNYLCKRKGYAFLKEADELNLTSPLLKWMSETKTGEWQELENKFPKFFWKKVESHGATCFNKNCPHFKSCYYFRARYRADAADILIVNHHLFITDLSKTDNRFIDKTDVVIIDEAHNFVPSIESISTEMTSQLEIGYQIKSLEDIVTNTKFLSFFKNKMKYLNLFTQTEEYTALFKQENKKFWKEFTQIVKDSKQINLNDDKVDISQREEIYESLKGYMEAIDQLRGVVNILDAELDPLLEDSGSKMLTTKTYIMQISVIVDFLEGLKHIFKDLFIDKSDDLKVVKWIEVREKNIVFNALDLVNSFDLSKQIIKEEKSYLFTSATLSIGDNFTHLKKPLNIQDAQEYFLDSPFNLKDQIDFYVSNLQYSYMDKNYYKDLTNILNNILKEGHALVLFSSYYDMNTIFKSFKKLFDDDNIDLFIQGREYSRTELIDIFKERENSILFATRSFWEGIDVKGEKLSNVVIVKLPFKSVNDPVLHNKDKLLKSVGRNSFYELMLPDMILTLRQGIGRLIRSKTDKGKVYILDRRFKYSNYADRILREFDNYEVKDLDTSKIKDAPKAKRKTKSTKAKTVKAKAKPKKVVKPKTLF